MSAKYEKESGSGKNKKIVHDKQAHQRAIKQAYKLRSQSTGQKFEDDSKRSTGMLSAFMAMKGVKIEVVQKIETKEAWEAFIKQEQEKEN